MAKTSLAESPITTLGDLTAAGIVLRPDFFIPIDGQEPETSGAVSGRSRAFSATIAWVVEHGDPKKDIVRDEEGVCMGLTFDALLSLAETVRKDDGLRHFGPHSRRVVEAVIEDHMSALSSDSADLS
jgi:hypothetical protein